MIDSVNVSDHYRACFRWNGQDPGIRTLAAGPRPR